MKNGGEGVGDCGPGVRNGSRGAMVSMWLREGTGVARGGWLWDSLVRNGGIKSRLRPGRGD